MEKYNFKIKRRFYPGGEEVIPTTLPNDYVYKDDGNAPLIQSCTNCYFNNAGFCDYWKASIRNEYWCGEWTSQLTPFNDLPEPAPCLTGYTLPILLTQDFNDIGVYTPWDGLVLQRDVVNNFVYTGYNQSICVFNTSDVELKRFLTFADYRIDWGDGSPLTFLTLPSTKACHNYISNPTTGHTITLSQSNPWGTTRIKKRVTTPYYENPIIPNVFGTISFAPPNMGDPVGCEYVLQNYIFSGDSNPDVYDHFSSRYVNTPIPVTGYTDITKIQLFGQYGPNYLPPIGVQIDLPDESYGTIHDITDAYTSYTINYINYIDYPNGSTYFEAMSFGLNENNLDYVCCTDEEEGCDCKRKPNFDCWMCSQGSECMTIYDYLQGGGPGCVNMTTQECFDSWAVQEPDGTWHGGSGQEFFCTEAECRRGCGGAGSGERINTVGENNVNSNYSPYSARVGYSSTNVVIYHSTLYSYGGNTTYGTLSEYTTNETMIDLRYYAGDRQLNYINQNGESYGECLSTPPEFDPQHWETQTGEQYNGYVTIWELI